MGQTRIWRRTNALAVLTRVTRETQARVLVFENAGPCDLAVSLLSAMTTPPYDVVVFGGGNPFPSSVVRLAALRPSGIAYAGDLDSDGLAIATSAAATMQKAGLPTLVPAPGLHAAMLAGARTLASPDGWLPCEKKAGGRRVIPDAHAMTRWLPDDVQESVMRVLQLGRRIPRRSAQPRSYEDGVTRRAYVMKRASSR